MATRIDQMEKVLSESQREILFARVATNLLKEGKIQEAIGLCENGLKQFPYYAQGHYILAKCYMKKKMFDEARLELERVLRYDANHLNAIKELAGIYQATGLDDIYREYLMQLYTLDPLNESISEELKNSGAEGPEAESELLEADVSAEGEKTTEALPVEDFAIDEEHEKEIIADEDIKKVDLSQFDNTEDDFETILAGDVQKPGEGDQPDEFVMLDADDNIEDSNLRNHRSEFESEDLKPRTGADDGAQKDGEANDFENFDELTFDETPEDKSKPGELEEWAKKVKDSDTTEIMINPLQDPDQQNITRDKFENIDLDTKPAEEKPARVKETSTEKSSGEEEEKVSFQQPKIISQTLGEILVSQKKYVEALKVFETLREQQPREQEPGKEDSISEQDHFPGKEVTKK